MGGITYTGRRVVHLSGPRLYPSDEFLWCARVDRGMNDQEVGTAADQADGSKVTLGVVRQLLIERGTNGMSGSGDEQRTAVRSGPRHYGGTDLTIGSGTVVDDDLVPDTLGELVGDNAGQRVIGTARRLGDDQPHRARRQVLGTGRGNPYGECCNNQKA